MENDPMESGQIISVTLSNGGSVTVGAYKIVEGQVLYNNFCAKNGDDMFRFPQGSISLDKLSELGKTDDEKVLKFLELLGMSYFEKNKEDYLSQIGLA